MGAVEEGSDEGSDDEEASVADTNDMEYETVSAKGCLGVAEVETVCLCKYIGAGYYTLINTKEAGLWGGPRV